MRFVFGLIFMLGFAASADAASIAAGPWPMSSDHPVEPLPHPTLEQRVLELGDAVDEGFRLAVFGDQRALADGEWQNMVRLIRDREDRAEPELPLLAVIDSGDIVFDGSKSDQFHMLTDILAPLRSWPYLVGIGNHEVHNNQPGPARSNVVRYLEQSFGANDPEPVELHEDRLYYRVDVGGVRMLFMDTSDLVYGPNGDRGDAPGLSYRGRAQMRWLTTQLGEADGIHTTIVLTHHPMIHSSSMHRAPAAKLWSLRYDGRTLPQIFAEGGVDLVLAGHTHTYERYRLTAPGGESFNFINVSGRPRNAVLWFGKKGRKAHDIAGREADYFRSHGWGDLDGWSIEQIEAMLGDGDDQWAEIAVRPDSITSEVFYLIDKGRGGVRTGGLSRLD